MASNNNVLFIIMALATGTLIPMQAATNTSFSKSIGSPYITGLMVFIIGLAAMLLFLLVTKTPLPNASQLAKPPFYSYIGGLVVAAYVIMITIITPRLGVGPAIGLIVTGQIVCAVIIDHFGLFHMNIRRIDAGRVIGVLLMIGGIFLVMRKGK